MDRMASLIRQMLAFSSKQVMQQRPLDVHDILEKTSEVLVRLLGEQVGLRFDIDPNLPPVMADPEMFQQILVNLVVNARDAMGKGGLLTIRATDARFSPEEIPAKSDRKPGHFVRLSVTDTGSGMDTTIINRLFEPFFTTKEIGKGIGLGLATVHGIVNQHQGWVEVDSKLGQGTTFDVYLPTTDKIPEKAVLPTELVDIRGGQETVMVVEDEAVLRELVREILSIHGYTVVEAANGVEAIRVWEEHGKKIDLLLTDVAMPHGLTGRDLAEQFRKENPKLPVIFSSGYTHEILEFSQNSFPCTLYLSKPYNPAQLAQIVRQALDAPVSAPAT
jgi:two-component system, cell cycle sensor histidine kinase and response regulator CckA